MKSIDEAYDVVLERLGGKANRAVEAQNFQDLYAEPKLLKFALVLADDTDGQNAKIMRALTVGVMIGMETQR